MTLTRPAEILKRPIKGGPGESILVDELAKALVGVIAKAQRSGRLAKRAAKQWPEKSKQRPLHIGRAQAYQEILTNIESGGANSL